MGCSLTYRATSHNQDCTRASVPRTNAEATAAACTSPRSRHPQARPIHPQADHPSQHPIHNHTPTDHSTPQSTMRASHGIRTTHCVPHRMCYEWFNIVLYVMNVCFSRSLYLFIIRIFMIGFTNIIAYYCATMF